jgi:di/tricarboxylate transporter
MPVAFAIVAAMIAAVAVGGADVATAALAAAVALVCFGCLSADEAFRRVDWRGLVFIGAMLALGDAMVSTEAAAHTGRFALQVARVPWAGFLGVLGLGVLMNQALPSVAATAVLAPVALQAAERLGANPAAFMMAVVAATGTTFTPVSNPVNLLVMTPGGYTVGDYLRVGAPLAAALFLVSALVIPLVWPLVLR